MEIVIKIINNSEYIADQTLGDWAQIGETFMIMFMLFLQYFLYLFTWSPK